MELIVPSAIITVCSSEHSVRMVFRNRASSTSSVINAFGMKTQEVYEINFNFTIEDRNEETMFSETISSIL
ncbi:hypothetical protein ACXYMX_10825, partial [Sporosarcina sp. CAU 1771]